MNDVAIAERPEAAAPAASVVPHHVYLIDGSGFIFRAYHALPPLTRSDGTPTAAVLGFSNMLAKLLSETDADHIAVVFDAAGATFRNRLYDAYKANRGPPPDDLVPQFALVREATDAFGVCRIEMRDFEADDLIATYARHAVAAGATVTIVSSDKDLMQLVNHKVTMLDPINNKPIAEPQVREKFGVSPDKVVDVQALFGDSVDNVPGVKGISVDTAAQLINEFGDLETLLDRAEETEAFKQHASDKANEFEERIYKIAGKKINIGSLKQLGEVLFDELKLPGGQKGKTGNYAVGSEVLASLAARGTEIAALVLQWRFYSRLAANFADLLKDQAPNARLSKELVKLDDDVPLPCPLADLRVKPLDLDQLLPFLRHMEFRALEGRMRQRAPGPASVPVPAGPSEPVIPEIMPFTAEHTYAVVDTIEGLEHWVEAAVQAGQVAIWPAPSVVAGTRPELCGLAVALAPGLAAYVPLGHRATERQTNFDLDASQAVMAGLDPATHENEDVDARNKSGHDEQSKLPRLTIDEVLVCLKPLLEDPGVLKIGHDMKGAAHLLRRYDIALGPTDCTMLMSYVLDGGQVEHGIAELTGRALSHELASLKGLIGTGKSLIGFAEVPIAAARDFAAERADAALRLHGLLKARLVREHMATFYETIERPLIPVVAEMEDHGVKVDREALAELSRDFARRIADIEQSIWRDVGNEFNIGSTKQLGDVLFEKLQMPGGKKGKTGAYGTDAGVLETLAPLHPVPAQVLEWRQLTKLKSTYADALGQEIDSRTGRVHTSFALAATATGRLSSSEPNIQNIPIRTEEGRKIRRAFVAEPGNLLLSADYSQIELRLAAHVADVTELKRAFQEGHDIHALTASEVFGVPLDKMDPQTRRRAKAINFGIIYGISAFGLGNQIGVPQSEAADYIRAYFERFPAIRAYMEKIKGDARRAGYVETIFGRKCFIPGIRDANPARRAGAERQAINAPLQGSAADIIKRAMGRLPAALAAAGLKARMLLQVHDELLFETPEAEVEPTARLVKAVMEGACAPRCELSVPLVVETGWATSWDQAH